MVSRPVVSRIVLAVSLLLAPCLPWIPWLPFRLPWSPDLIGCFFTVGSWSPVSPVASRGIQQSPDSPPVVSRGLPFRFPWSPVSPPVVSVARVVSRGLPNCKPLIPVVEGLLPSGCIFFLCLLSYSYFFLFLLTSSYLLFVLVRLIASSSYLWAAAAATDPSWDRMSGERESRGILCEHIARF